MVMTMMVMAIVMITHDGDVVIFPVTLVVTKRLNYDKK